MNQESMQCAVPPMTPVVKTFLILSGGVFLLQLLLGQFAGFALSGVLGFVPGRLAEGWVWQPFTYVFLHAGLFHLLFNLLILWTVGAELEAVWGAKTFLAFFFVCGVGAALCSGLFSLVGIGPGPWAPVVGSSGVIYGLLLAYGILFGDRLMYFFLLFPMQARYFMLLLGGIELVSSVFYSRDGVAHLAHLGGMAFGFLFLASMAAWRKRSRSSYQDQQAGKLRQKRLKKAGHLRLVRGEDESDDEPKHWN
jgi:membrane associated rhomboid family serine protease